MSRGLRNNNPGNIRVSANPWRGKIVGAAKKDRVFEEFVDMAHGYRALLINLRTYINRDRINTIRGIITRWAPPEENQTEKYINMVCNHMGVAAGYQVNAENKEDMTKLAAAISRVENGVDAVMKDIDAGWALI